MASSPPKSPTSEAPSALELTNIIQDKTSHEPTGNTSSALYWRTSPWPHDTLASVQEKQERNISATKDRGFLEVGRDQNNLTSRCDRGDLKGPQTLSKHLELQKPP